MPSDSNLPNLPQSPIENDDLWLVNREDKSYKVTSQQLGGYLIGIEAPSGCELDTDCPPGQECNDSGFCEPIRCNNGSCPAGYDCYNGYCYPSCTVGSGSCGDGYICVNPGNTIGPICIEYPFACDDSLPGGGCPPGFDCWGGYCYQSCSSAGCPPGMDCVSTGLPIGQEPQQVCVFPDGGFPCADGTCPEGYGCHYGMCFAKCGDAADPNGGVCGDGFQCVEINGETFCVPYPFPCGLYTNANDGCPPGMHCYNGQCYPECSVAGGSGECEAGFSCIDIGGGITICYPDKPQERFVNDGPLVFRGQDSSGNPHEEIVFTANQYGRSVINFSGFVISGNPGGGSGGTIDIEVNTENLLWDDNGGSYSPKRDNRNIIPNGTGNIGGPTAAERWNNIYTNDLHLSNEGKSNDVDGTWGDWTIQEGEDDLFLINNRTGKKFAFVLKPID